MIIMCSRHHTTRWAHGDSRRPSRLALAADQREQRADGAAGQAALPDAEAVGGVVEQPGGDVAGRVERRPAVGPVEQRRERGSAPRPGRAASGRRARRGSATGHQVRDRALPRGRAAATVPPPARRTASRHAAASAGRPGTGQRSPVTRDRRRASRAVAAAVSAAAVTGPPGERGRPRAGRPPGGVQRADRAGVQLLKGGGGGAVVGAAGEPGAEGDPVVMAHDRFRLVADPPAGRRHAPNEVDVLPDVHALP